jgi:hypothetical protein
VRPAIRVNLHYYMASVLHDIYRRVNRVSAFNNTRVRFVTLTCRPLACFKALNAICYVVSQDDRRYSSLFG